MPEQGKIEEFSNHVKQYVNTNYELVKLEATAQASQMGSGLISYFIVGFVSCLFIFFLSIGAGFYISFCMGDTYSGFGIVAGFYGLLMIILMAARKSVVVKPLRDKLIRKMLGDNDDE